MSYFDHINLLLDESNIQIFYNSFSKKKFCLIKYLNSVIILVKLCCVIIKIDEICLMCVLGIYINVLKDYYQYSSMP